MASLKTIGLIGGMSCESSAEYYRLINEYIRTKLGGLNSAKIIMNSLNFQEIADLQRLGKWDELQNIINQAGLSLEKAGVDCAALCTNLMHKCAPILETTLKVPFIHIVDSCAEALLAKKINKVLLLGAIYTMEENFYSDRLKNKFNIETIIPSPEDRKIISDIIYQELCQGRITKTARQEYLRIINLSANNGAQAALLACTEIPLLIKDGDADIPLFETTKIHAATIAEFAFDKVLSS